MEPEVSSSSGKPFHITGPATISFSGGRTSGYMLRRILDEGLQPEVDVLFANTGKERPETLDFIHEVQQRWSVPIHWLEFRDDERGWADVTFDTASRQGEPFDALIRKRRFLPNPVTRFCTQELKIRVMQKWAIAAGFEHWTNVVGIRADEPRRVAKMNASNDAGKERWEVYLPLAISAVTLLDVDTFWAGQVFRLDLQPWEGNCDLCFLKGRAKKERIIRDRPDLVEWWIAKEQTLVDKAGRPSLFRIDGPNYASMVRRVRAQPLLPFGYGLDESDDLGDCICHD